MKKINKKLQLNKETIAALNNDEQKVIYGGEPSTWNSAHGFVTNTCDPKYTCTDQNTNTCNPPTANYMGSICCPPTSTKPVCPVVVVVGPAVPGTVIYQPYYTEYC